MEINFFDEPNQRTSETKKQIIKKQGKNRNSLMTKNYEKFGYDYFDNKKSGVGAGGYYYDKRFEAVAKNIISHYQLKPQDRILEIGCAKGFLLVEFKKQGMATRGIDISEYAILNTHPEVKRNIMQYDITKGIPFEDDHFDFIVSKETLPHISKNKIDFVLSEISRCAKKNKSFLEIQCAETQKGLKNMKLWDKTHKIIWTPQQWKNLFKKVNYSGDYHFKLFT